jgi:hypothetical protein
MVLALSNAGDDQSCLVSLFLLPLRETRVNSFLFISWRSEISDVHGLGSGQKPSQAKPKVLAWVWLWLGLDFPEAKANGPGHVFKHKFCRQL